jgi:hypothetical protein
MERWNDGIREEWKGGMTGHGGQWNIQYSMLPAFQILKVIIGNDPIRWRKK